MSFETFKERISALPGITTPPKFKNDTEKGLYIAYVGELRISMNSGGKKVLFHNKRTGFNACTDCTEL